MRETGHAVSPDVARRRWAAVTAQRERLLRIARTRTLNEQDAEDCVHEAMVRCVEFADLDEARLEAFLTTVTMRLCADTHRARKQRDRVGPRLVGPLTDPGHEEEVCDQAEAVWVADRFLSLPPRQQEVVTARAAGMSYADTARRFGMSAAAVESMLSRARRTVRAAHATTFAWLLFQVRRARVLVPSAGAAVSAAAVITVATGLSLQTLLPSPDPGRRRPDPGVSADPNPRSILLVEAPSAPYPGVTPAPAAPTGSADHASDPEPLVSTSHVVVPPPSANPVATRDPVTYWGDCARYGFETPGPVGGHVRCADSPAPASD